MLLEVGVGVLLDVRVAVLLEVGLGVTLRVAVLVRVAVPVGVTVPVAVNVRVMPPLNVGVGLAVGVGGPFSAALTPRTNSLIDTAPSPSASKLLQPARSCAPSAMFTPMISSLMATTPSPLQSPVSGRPAGPLPAMETFVGVGVGVGAIATSAGAAGANGSAGAPEHGRRLSVTRIITAPLQITLGPMMHRRFDRSYLIRFWAAWLIDLVADGQR